MSDAPVPSTEAAPAGGWYALVDDRRIGIGATPIAYRTPGLALSVACRLAARRQRKSR